ncbi:YjeF N-terminal domain-like protein [Violaceomyces palustris]|uniref:YjeF N-terminal domain-like protein n=1 Tax=Violaceomyces palustris TaxID=1673888 RepID=A0ACD0P2Q6_9BASI|nr:YjeF N-terminal domain-like protein [Violaceomyces palustris]
MSSSSPSSSPRSSSPLRIRHLSATEALKIDEELMSPEGGFSIDQLMELAGLSCAQTVFACYPPTEFPNVLVACGPGNQGGDGLVAARHLYHWGYEPTVWYPKEGKRELFQRLKTQLNNLRITFINTEDFQDALGQADVVLDSVFGFSFKGEPREPFKAALQNLCYESRVEFEARRPMPPIISVDIPSSWDVEQGNVSKAFTPSVLVSLTAPKLGSRFFQGRHFLGGRFISEDLEEKYDLRLPDYPGCEHIVEITGARPLEEQEEYMSQQASTNGQGGVGSES